MSTHRPRRVGRFRAERLIGRFRAGRLPRVEPEGQDRLAELLGAACAPADRGELAGEETAMAAFREAHLRTVPRQRRESMVKTALAKLVTLKVVAATITATAAGGFALAASTGHLPAPTLGTTPTARPTPATTSGAVAPHPTGRPSTPPGGRSPGTSASSSLARLCRAYEAGDGGGHGRILDDPAFSRLVNVAGGKDKVAAYCAYLFTTSSPGTAASSHPGGTAPTYPHPTPASGDRRTGMPSVPSVPLAPTLPDVPVRPPTSHLPAGSTGSHAPTAPKGRPAGHPGR